MEDVFAVGQQVIGGAGLAFAVGDQSFDHLAGLVLFPFHNHRVAGIVDNLEGNTFKIGVTLRCGAGDGILLFHAQAAPFYLIHGSNRNRMALLPYSDGFAGPGQQHGLICLRFFHFIGAVRQSLAAGAGMARFVCGDGHDHIAHGVGGAVHHHGVGASVDDLKIDVGKGGVALGSGPHLAVLLLDLDTAPHHIIFGVVLQHLTILVDGHGDFFPEGFQHGFIGGNLTDSVVAVGQSTLPSGGHTAGVGGNGHGHLAGSCG